MGLDNTFKYLIITKYAHQEKITKKFTKNAEKGKLSKFFNFLKHGKEKPKISLLEKTIRDLRLIHSKAPMSPAI